MTRGVAVAEFLQILSDALLEILGANIGLDHSKDTCAFPVTDLIEQFLNLFRVMDLRHDGMGLGQSVAAHRARCGCSDKILPDLPFWIGSVSGLEVHESGEALVQPEIVPPFHCDQISKPHVSNLMGDHMSYGFPSPDTRVLVYMQENFSVGYGSPVLHRPVGKFWDGYIVEFG